ncbi:MarR family transcriptional regulator [Actinoplanes sp. NPDC089786]|uniref:MarR family winged helix-turn-helix transcriptional regulator n=1 Tax=Actinoplanes sp. NPDC089786 TaxID=3155185 RepID=UPI00341BB874
MGEHHGPVVPDPMRAAALDDAAQTLLATWEAAREQSTPRLSAAQLNALIVVEKDEGINLRTLAGRLRMILSSASRLCDRLVAAGLVDRAPGRIDRREIALYLTPYSRQLLDELRASRLALLGSALDRMSPAGRAALVRGLSEFAVAAAESPSDTSRRTA